MYSRSGNSCGSVVLQNLAVLDDSPQLGHDCFVAHHLLANHGVLLVVGVVSITQLPIRPELELEKFVPEFALVTNVVSNIKVICTFTRLNENST